MQTLTGETRSYEGRLSFHRSTWCWSKNCTLRDRFIVGLNNGCWWRRRLSDCWGRSWKSRWPTITFRNHGSVMDAWRRGSKLMDRRFNVSIVTPVGWWCWQSNAVNGIAWNCYRSQIDFFCNFRRDSCHCLLILHLLRIIFVVQWIASIVFSRFSMD